MPSFQELLLSFELSNLSSFASKNSVTMLLLVRVDIVPHGEGGSELIRDFYGFVFPVKLPSHLLIFTLLVSA